MRLARPLVWALALAAVGCDRTPRLVPPGADSTAALTADSAAIYVQMARERWESPDRTEEAARFTARLLLDDLRGHPGEPLAARARDLIDSLAMGAETAGRGRVAIVNLFARSNPTGGAWPWLFWRDAGATWAQALEAGGMHLAGVTLEPVDGATPARVAALFSRVGGAGPQPFAFVWERPTGGTTWRLVQSLGADSLGRVGTARFVDPRADGVVLVSRTHEIARGFDECASCPHVYRTRSFRWGVSGLIAAGEDVERTPYYSFVQFIQALVTDDRWRAQRWVADGSIVETAVGHEWERPKGLWRLAPGTAPNARELLILRGTQEAYRVHFATRGDEWVITAIEPTTRTLE